MQSELEPREQRTALRGAVRYECEGPEDQGVARWHDVSRVGAALRLGRYLRPGRTITLGVESPLVSDAALAVRAQIVWCRAIPGSQDFVAGLRVRRDTPEMALDFAALGRRARAEANNKSEFEVSTPVWPGLGSRTRVQTNTQPIPAAHYAAAI